MEVAPLASLRVERHHVPAHGRLPNSDATGKPLLLYRAAFGPADKVTPAAVEAHLEARGRAVRPQWRYGMYPTTHFHSTAHEVLAVTRGRARLCFGGERNGGRVEVEVGVGDVLVVPAGVAHRLLEDLGGGAFEMVGSYPPGAQWDMCYGREGEEDKVEGIGALGWFERDPVYGEEGPVLKV